MWTFVVMELTVTLTMAKAGSLHPHVLSSAGSVLDLASVYPLGHLAHLSCAPRMRVRGCCESSWENTGVFTLDLNLPGINL